MKCGPLLKSFFSSMNAEASNVLKVVDPIKTVSLGAHYKPVKTNIESINGVSTCDYKLKQVVGLGTQRFSDVTLDGDFPTGLGSFCKV